MPLAALPLPRCFLQDAVRGEFREVAKLLSDNGGRIYEDGGLVRAECSWAGANGRRAAFRFVAATAACCAAVSGCIHHSLMLP